MNKKVNWLLLGILFISLALRLFKLRDLSYFSMDEAYIAFRALGLFKDKIFFLIGAASPLKFHLPPYFFYFSSMLIALFNFDPIGWGFWGALIGVLSVYLIYKLTKDLFSQQTAYISSILYATSFTAVFFDRHYWPLNLNPFYLVASFILIKKLDKKTFWPYLGLSAVILMSFTSDPSNLPLIITILVSFFLQKKIINKKFITKSLSLLFFLFFAPLIIFDIRHNWVNLPRIVELFNDKSAFTLSLGKIINAVLLLPRSLVRFWYSPQTNLVELHSYCIPYANSRQFDLPVILLIISVLILTWFVFYSFKSKKLILKLMSILPFIYLLGIIIFTIFGFSIFDHYLAGLLPIFAIATAVFISKLPKILAISLLILIVSVNFFQISKANNPYGLLYKQNLVAWATENLRGQNYNLQSISKCHRENGLRYLFELTDNPPKQSFMDPNFAWLYRQAPSPSKIIPDKTLVVTDKPLNTSLNIEKQQSFGALDAYILVN
jgi:dolichyl-phosphate-mannose-protein mannosyltransferase